MAYDTECNIEKRIEELPYEIIPGEVGSFRNDVFLERAIVGERLRLAMGLPCRSAAEHAPLSDRIELADKPETYYTPPLINVIKFACNACHEKRVYVTDGYRDTVEDGIAIVKEYIASLANDEKTQALVNMVFRLLSRDAKGTLKASRIVQLRKVAEDTGDARFLEGVRIIEESYQPEVSKQFIRAEVKDKNGMWKPIPLGMTES